jgi:RNA polymerase sigma factor (TIGR02999 family)
VVEKRYLFSSGRASRGIAIVKDTLSDPAVTELLQAWYDGQPGALERLIPVVHAELRRIARANLGRERPNHTLQPTALVHEAYLRLVQQRNLRFANRTQFFAIAARLMRRVLVDHARRRLAARRDPGSTLTLREATRARVPQQVDILALNQALTRLAEVDTRQSQFVELRYFGGLTVEETGDVLGLSPATVKREWSLARLWLVQELSPP